MIHQLTLRDFRSYHDRTFTFTGPATVIIGPNGQGKTNLLEALELFSVGKSWRTTTTRQLIAHQAESAQLTLSTQVGDTYGLTLTPRTRRLTRHGKARPWRQHLGQLPTLVFAPEFLHLFRADTTTRQRYFDRILVQTSPLYATALTQFQRALRHRNALLRADIPPTPADLHPWCTLLSQHGPTLHLARQSLATSLTPLLATAYAQCAGTATPASVSISNDLPPAVLTDSTALLTHLQTHAPRDIAARRTLTGPHRDQWLAHLRDHPLHATASRGELRTFFLSLLTALRATLTQHLSHPPVLLLDDVFSELDTHRQAQLQQLCHGTQTFFTTTHASHCAGFATSPQIIDITPLSA